MWNKCVGTGGEGWEKMCRNRCYGVIRAQWLWIGFPELWLKRELWELIPVPGSRSLFWGCLGQGDGPLHSLTHLLFGRHIILRLKYENSASFLNGRCWVIVLLVLPSKQTWKVGFAHIKSPTKSDHWPRLKSWLRTKTWHSSVPCICSPHLLILNLSLILRL